MTRRILTRMSMLVVLVTGCGDPKYVPDITLTQTGPRCDSWVP